MRNQLPTLPSLEIPVTKAANSCMVQMEEAKPKSGDDNFCRLLPELEACYLDTVDKGPLLHLLQQSLLPGPWPWE